MKTKMVEWSSRRIQVRTPGDQLMRWYRALTPNSAASAAT